MQTGADGEAIAAEYLTGKGYEIVEFRYRYRHCEIDLIARKPNWLFFIEVKTRSNADYGFPEQFVDRAQEECILKAAEYYMEKIDWKGNVRYDIISILGTDSDRDVQHFQDAFY